MLRNEVAILGLNNTTTFRFRAAQVQIMYGIILEFESLSRVLLDTKLMHGRAGGPPRSADTDKVFLSFRNIPSEVLDSLRYSEMQ